MFVAKVLSLGVPSLAYCYTRLEDHEEAMNLISDRYISIVGQVSWYVHNILFCITISYRVTAEKLAAPLTLASSSTSTLPQFSLANMLAWGFCIHSAKLLMSQLFKDILL